MTLLIHACCGPCLLYPADLLNQDKADFTVYFNNPNIHPYKEFRARLNALVDLCAARNFRLIAERDYGLKEFLRAIVFKENDRCTICYYSRIKKTAQLASENGFSSFSSTLLYSRYQNHDLIKQHCNELSTLYAVPFFYRDFRLGWESGVEESKHIGIYRQKYCGCIYSEQERYDNRYKKKLIKERKNNV